MRMRTPKGPRHRRDTTTRTGVVALAVVAGVLWLSVTHNVPFLGGDGGRKLTVILPAAAQVNSATPVRVRGVDVGRVDDVRVLPGGRAAEVRLVLTDNSVSLHQGASAAARFRTLLGGSMQIVLDPGRSDAPPLRGLRLAGGLPPAQVEVDDVLRSFDGRVRKAQRTVLKQLPESLADDRAGRVVDALGSSLASGGPAFRALRGNRPGDLRALARSAAATTRSLAADGRALGELIKGASVTFGAMAAARRSLGDTLDGSPAAMDQAVTTSRAVTAALPDLDRLVTALGPAADELRPAVATARPTIRSLNLTLREARPLLADLRPAVRTLVRAAEPGSRFLAAVEPTLDRLNDQTLPWLERVESDAKRPVYQTIAPVITALASAFSEFGEEGYFPHFPVSVGAGSMTLIPCAADLTDSQLVRCKLVNETFARIFGGAKR